MPLIKKIIRVGTSKAITLPPEWLEWVKRETGEELREVALEIDSNLVVIPLPLLSRKKEAEP